MTTKDTPPDLADGAAEPGANGPDARRILTPSRLNAEAQVVIEENFGLVWIEGELGNFSKPASGHWYFTLKDRNAQVRCAMFRGRNARVPFAPEVGMQVLLHARVGLYVGRGEFQLVVESMEPAGEGALRLAFDQLRKRLAAEGLFDDERKRPLPPYPRRIGVVTSATGAAVRDIRSVLARRWPLAQVLLVPTPVQGDAATDALVDALRRLGELPEATRPELVILGRGGGSLEDLWCFNEERLARAVAASPMPVVSAVGHETDFTIADFVADLRAPTPSAAAELVTPDASDLTRSLAVRRQQLTQQLRQRVRSAMRDLALNRRALRDPSGRLRELAQRVDELDLRSARAQQQRLARAAERLGNLRARLDAADPRARLRNGQTLLAQLTARLQARTPQSAIEARRSRIADLARSLHRSATEDDARRRALLARSARALQALSPLGVVDRGYALLMQPPETDDGWGALVRTPEGLAKGDRLVAQLAGGRLRLRVDEQD